MTLALPLVKQFPEIVDELFTMIIIIILSCLAY